MTTHITTLTINGDQVTITREHVLLTAADAVPRDLPRRHAVRVGAVLWAPKDLLRKVVDRDDLGNVDSPRAMKAFKGLGFQTFTETVYTADGLPFVHPDNRPRSSRGKEIADTCPVTVDAGGVCGAALRWEVTPEGGEAYVACGQHVTAPIMRAGALVPFTARPLD
ncbi:hypothetical protein [Streptomyces sp. NPDC053431]|uniref:hypothetical protein n=1 Tax=Streptomyces sp. NPDC053431 TaxID=3365703 RepID=UPI0037D4BC9D